MYTHEHTHTLTQSHGYLHLILLINNNLHLKCLTHYILKMCFSLKQSFTWECLCWGLCTNEADSSAPMPGFGPSGSHRNGCNLQCWIVVTMLWKHWKSKWSLPWKLLINPYPPVFCPHTPPPAFCPHLTQICINIFGEKRRISCIMTSTWQLSKVFL